MVGLLKGLGKGILYILAFPFFILAIALYGVYGLLLFLYTLVKMIFYFFTGKSVFADLPEDRMAKAILTPKPAMSEVANSPINNNEPVPPVTQSVPIQNVAPAAPIHSEVPSPEEINADLLNDDLKDLHPIQEEVQPIQEEIEEVQEEIQDQIVEPEPQIQEQEQNELDFNDPFEPKTEEPLEKYEPKGSTFDGMNDGDSHSSNSGVKIERS